MGPAWMSQRHICQRCEDPDQPASERGYISLMAVLCDRCWNALANETALAEGATDQPPAEFDPDDVTWVEPPTCRECDAQVRHLRTNYDRWIFLAIEDLPAKEIPRRYRWRIQPVPARNSSIPVGCIAVKI